MAHKILIVDDEQEIADLIELYLKNENYDIYKFYDSKSALECIDSQKLDLAILDVMLPDISGFDILRHIRERDNYPIIMLTAKTEETDKITGLTMGADDYVTKPFRPLELVARVKAQLRRYTKYNDGAEKDLDLDGRAQKPAYRGIVVNEASHQCFVDGVELTLTPTEFTILRVLIERKGEVVSAEELFHQVWKDEYYNKSNNTITVHIRHLREKMKDATDNPKYIKTIWGVGYKIEG